MSEYMTVGRLKELLNHLKDDTPVVVIDHFGCPRRTSSYEFRVDTRGGTVRAFYSTEIWKTKEWLEIPVVDIGEEPD